MIDPGSDNQVEEVDRAISAAERQLVLQAARVAELQADGRDARLAEAQMAKLETTLNALRLRREIAVSGGLPGQMEAAPQPIAMNGIDAPVKA